MNRSLFSGAPFLGVLLTAVLAITPDAQAQYPFADCGTVVLGPAFDCSVFFVTDDGQQYVLNDYMGLQIGEYAFVEGLLWFPVPPLHCYSICGGPCINVDAIGPCERFLRGDVNDDGLVDVTDPVALLGALFLSQPVLCEDALDVNDDQLIDLSDSLQLLQFLFAQGPAPAQPYPACGFDSADPDPLGCPLHIDCP